MNCGKIESPNVLDFANIISIAISIYVKDGGKRIQSVSYDIKIILITLFSYCTLS